MPLPRLFIGRAGIDNPARVFLRDEVLGPLQARVEESPISRSHEAKYREQVANAWKGFIRINPGPWMLAEGCEVLGFDFRLIQGTPLLRWQTRTMNPRHPTPGMEHAALGTWGPYDLYLGFEGPSMPIAIALDGRAAEEWRLYHYTPREPGSVIRETIRRAQLANALAGTQWAEPSPGGSLAVPIKPKQEKAP